MTSDYKQQVVTLVHEVEQKRALEKQYMELEHNYKQFQSIVRQHKELLNREKGDFQQIVTAVENGSLSESKNPRWVQTLTNRLQDQIDATKENLKKLYDSAAKKCRLLEHSRLNDIPDIKQLQPNVKKIASMLHNKKLTQETLKKLHRDLGAIRKNFVTIAKNQMLGRLELPENQKWRNLYTELGAVSFKQKHRDLKKSIAQETSLSKQEAYFHEVHLWFEELFDNLYKQLFRTTQNITDSYLFIGERAYRKKERLEYFLNSSVNDFDKLQEWYNAIKKVQSQIDKFTYQNISFYVCIDNRKKFSGLQFDTQKIAFYGNIHRCKKRIVILNLPVGIVSKNDFDIRLPQYTYWSYFILKALTFGKVSALRFSFKASGREVRKKSFIFSNVFSDIYKLWWAPEEVGSFITSVNQYNRNLHVNFETLLKGY